MTRALRYALAAAAGVYLAAYLFVALSRIAYPFELEWIEGALVDHVRHLVAGNSFYVRPSLEFTPFFYPPLYFQLGAALSHLTGVGFMPLRLISFVSSLGCFALVLRLVWRDTSDRFCAWLAAGLFIATFRLDGAWYDLA